MPKNPNADPKPFVLVPIPLEAPVREHVAMHEKFRGLTGRLELTFTVVSEYIYVGSGVYEFDPNHGNCCPDVWHTFCRRNGQICIPGSSVKGAIRAIVEAISNSCVSQRHRRENVRSSYHQPCRFRSQKDPLCPACRLFGTTGYRGRVYFTDFLPRGEIKPVIVKIGELWNPKRFDQNLRRFYTNKIFQPIANIAPQSNFRFVEAIKKESKFQGVLIFENVNEAELGLLLHALGWCIESEKVNIAFAPKLGGAKPRCFGSVVFRPVKLYLWSGDMKGLLKLQVVQGKELLSLILRYLKECQNSGLLHLASWTALKDGFKPKNERCPWEVY